MRMRKMRLFLTIWSILLIFTSYTLAKGGRGGGGFGRSSGGSSWSSGRSSSSYSRPSSSYSRPSPSYSRPSPSYSYSRPSPSYSRPSPSYSAPSPSRPSPSYGWNVGGNTGSTATGSKPSSNIGWNVGGKTGSTATGSKPPSYGWNVGSPSTNTGSKPSNTNYGWNVGNTKPSAPVGPPPSYPGLQSRPVPSHNSPPAYSPSYHNPPSYSPSYHNPPSYSPSHTVYSPSSYNSPTYNRPSPSYGTSGFVNKNTYSTYGSNPGYNPYGNTFGSHGLGGNTYISNNYYGNQGGSRGSGFLTNALFYGAGMHSGYHWGRSSSYSSHHNDYNRRRGWDEEEDRNWRATTQATYFANKVPGEDKILPASAVIGAATAFGLVSLLPLNVPASKPIMYCNNSTDLMQAQIKINNQTLFQCINGTIEITCMKNTNETKLELVATTEMSSTESTSMTPVMAVNGTNSDPEITTEQLAVTGNETSTTENEPATTTQVSVKKESECESMKAMPCDVEVLGYYYCFNGTLFSKEPVFCNSTTFLNGTNVNETIAILNCYIGELPESQAAFIPTTTTTQAPVTEKSLSFAAKAHLFFLRLIGRDHTTTTQKPSTTPVPEEIPQMSAKDAWIPEALTIPPETTAAPETTEAPSPTTSTTEGPFVWMQKTFTVDENGNENETLEPVPKHLVELYELGNTLLAKNPYPEKLPSISPNWVKVYITTTPMSASNDSTTEIIVTESTAKADQEGGKTGSFEWKRNVTRIADDQSTTSILEEIPKELFEGVNMTNPSEIPSNWVKVYKNQTAEVTTIMP